MDVKRERMAAVLAAAERLARWSARAGGALMLAAAILVSVDVIMRKAIGKTVGGSDELSGYAFAISVSWSFAFVLLQRANVRVDALYVHLPAKLAALLDLVALVAMGSFAIVLARYGFEVASQSWTLSAHSNSSLGVPLWIPQGLWWLGLLTFVATLALLLVRGATLLVRGRWDELQGLIGARSTEEDAAEEAAYAQSQLEGHALEAAPSPLGKGGSR